MEAVVHGLARAQVRLGHDVEVLTLGRAVTDGSRLPPGVHEGVPYRRLRRIGSRRYPFAAGLVSALRGADVVHVHGLDGLADVAVASRRRHGARVGVLTHGGFLHTPRQARLKRLWMRTWTRRTLASADAVWFPSWSDQRQFARFGIDGTVILDGVDVERFATVERSPEAGRWLVLGRVDVHKGLDDLITAMAELRRFDTRPAEIVSVGPVRQPALRQRLETLADALRVPLRFRGEVPEAEVLLELARCEIALFPSRYEGFGIAVIEAMAAGAPVVVSTIEPFEQHVRSGVDGFRVDFTDAMGAGRALAELRQANLAAVGAAARTSAGRHGWSRRVEDWERAYARMGRR